jgi:hypothetical protein
MMLAAATLAGTVLASSALTAGLATVRHPVPAAAPVADVAVAVHRAPSGREHHKAPAPQRARKAKPAHHAPTARTTHHARPTTARHAHHATARHAHHATARHAHHAAARHPRRAPARKRPHRSRTVRRSYHRVYLSPAPTAVHHAGPSARTRARALAARRAKVRAQQGAAQALLDRAALAETALAEATGRSAALAATPARTGKALACSRGPA